MSRNSIQSHAARKTVLRHSLHLLAWTALALGAAKGLKAEDTAFHIEEASITDIQSAIQNGKTSCEGVVRAYIERARAYNGMCTALVTRDGAPIAPAKGMVRAGSVVEYPTKTVKVSTIFPDYDQYQGLPFEFGKMIPAASDPTVQLQYGLRAGIPEAGQVDALETLNIRGERSVTCKGEFDKAPSAGRLPAGAPKACEEFRKQPDAIERAAELDREYGKNPDLTNLPMYCAVFSLKNWYDAKDMRATGGNDVAYAMDAPRYDSPDVATLRSKGAIIYAVATASSVSPPSVQGAVKVNTSFPMGDLQYGPWGGHACNPYDTARVSRGTSNGSGVSVAANLATCSICEQTSASCKGPASRNNIVNLLPTKGIHQDGGETSNNAGDRAGIHCKTVKDAVLVEDAVKGYEPEDIFTAIPASMIPKQPFSSFLVNDTMVPTKPLTGVRVGVVREFMVKHTKNDEAISDQMDAEIKQVLRDKLGATIVETHDPLYPDDPDVPNMKYTFQDAMAEILPHAVPEFFYRKDKDGTLEFAVPGWDVRSVDYDVALALHRAPLSDKINLRTISEGGTTNPSSLINYGRYLALRGDERVKDAASWMANATFKSEDEKAHTEKAIGATDPRPRGEGISYLEMQAVLRMIVLKVMQENQIDVFVNPEQTTAPYVLGGAPEPEVNGRPSISCCTGFTALMGAPEADVPAGYVTTTYDPQWQLTPDKKEYVAVTGTVKATLPHPMPVSLMFWSGPGSDTDVIKVASAYESATHHRVPPPAFGPVEQAQK